MCLPLTDQIDMTFPMFTLMYNKSRQICPVSTIYLHCASTEGSREDLYYKKIF